MHTNLLNEVLVFQKGDLIIDDQFNKTGLIVRVSKSSITIRWFVVSSDLLSREIEQTKTRTRQRIMNGEWLYNSKNKKETK